MQSSRAEEFIDYRIDFFPFAYAVIIPNLLYCSLFSALIFLPKQSPFVSSLWIISESEALFGAIELLAKIAPTLHKRRQELLLLYFPDQNNLWWWTFFEVKSGPNPPGVSVYCDDFVCRLLS